MTDTPFNPADFFKPADMFKNIEAYTVQSKEAFEKAMAAATETLQKSFEDTTRLTQRKVEDVQVKVARGYEDMTAYNRENMEAVLAAGAAIAAGVKTLSEHNVALAQKSVETGVANVKALAAAKDINEAVTLQAGFAKTALETMVADLQTVQDLTAKVAQEALSPLQERAKAPVVKMAA